MLFCSVFSPFVRIHFICSFLCSEFFLVWMWWENWEKLKKNNADTEQSSKRDRKRENAINFCIRLLICFSFVICHSHRKDLQAWNFQFQIIFLYSLCVVYMYVVRVFLGRKREIILICSVAGVQTNHKYKNHSTWYQRQIEGFLLNNDLFDSKFDQFSQF
jgi:hypothetical protein